MIRSATAAALLGCAILASEAFGASPLLREIEETFIRLHETVSPCVVNVEVKGSPEEAGEEMKEFFHFFNIPAPEGDSKRQFPAPRSNGTGFIYDSQGHIVTNNHVVEGAEQITVRLTNGKEFEARVIGRDPDTDLAVIKIDAGEPLSAARLGNSDSLRVGQFAIAVGSPRGFEGSLSFGHISALGREGLEGLARQGLRFQNLIQTDAAINFGNSGGPLCNIDGEVIGINMAIVWGANSIGFAIPINVAKSVVPELIAEGKVTRGFLGVGIDDVRLYADAASMGLPDDKGAFVKNVQPGTPAEKAGVRYYDVIRKVNGEPVENAAGLVRKISSFAPGTTIMLEVWRDKQAIELEVELTEWSAEVLQTPVERPIFGMRVRPLLSDQLRRLGLEESTTGVLIEEIEAGSPADDADLRPGDIIVEVAQQKVVNPKEFTRLINEAAESGPSILIRYLRGGTDPDITVLRVPKQAPSTPR